MSHVCLKLVYPLLNEKIINERCGGRDSTIMPDIRCHRKYNIYLRLICCSFLRAVPDPDLLAVLLSIVCVPPNDYALPCINVLVLSLFIVIAIIEALTFKISLLLLRRNSSSFPRANSTVWSFNHDTHYYHPPPTPVTGKMVASS